MTSIEKSTDDLRESGERAEAGSFVCSDCSLPISLDHSGELPSCPSCGATEFKRASMFAEQPTLASPSIGSSGRASDSWLEGVRDSIDEPGKYLATYVDGRARVFELDAGWSRIGRGSSADIRLDDPRCHAVTPWSSARPRASCACSTTAA